MMTNNYTIINGNSLDELLKLQENSIDCIITDPPYELNFMNKEWDNSGVAFNKDVWNRCLRVLKHGGYLLAFGGTRTFHRIACAIEDAGFEIRDTIMWLYGSGFPKSFNIGKQIEAKVLFDDASGRSQKLLNGKKVEASMWTHHWSYENGKEKNDYSVLSNEKVIDVEYTTEIGKKWKGWGTQLKPSYEPIIVARKPVEKTIIDNIMKYGVGGINIDECRIENTENDTYDLTKRPIRKATGKKNDEQFLNQLHDQDAIHGVSNVGRFPSNVILTYDDTDYNEVCGGMPYTKSTGGAGEASQINTFKNVTCGVNGKNTGDHLGGLGDEGSASRYFYCAKASKKDRDDGLEIFDSQKEINNAFQRVESLRKNIHPTVKPTELMQYLIRLVAPKGATILDCFMGSGSTGKAVAYENKEYQKDYKFIGIELSKEYCEIAKARIEYANKYNISSIEKETKERKVAPEQMSIFDLED